MLQEMEKSMSATSDSSNEIARLSNELAAAEQTIQEKEIEFEEVKSHLVLEQEKSTGMSEAVEGLKDLEEKHAADTERINTLEAKSKKLQGLLKRADGVITEHKARHKEQQEEVSLLHEKVSELSEQQNASDSSRDAFVEELQQGLNASAEEIQELKAKEEASTERIKDLEKEVAQYGNVEDDLSKRLEEEAESKWNEKRDAMKAEHQAYRKKVQNMMQDKDKMISNLREQVKSSVPSSDGAAPLAVPDKSDISESLNNELHRYKKAFEDEAKAKKLLSDHVDALKEELAGFRRSKTVEDTPQEYLKNIVMAYMETGNHERLMPVLTTLLQLTPDDVKHVEDERAKRWW